MWVQSGRAPNALLQIIPNNLFSFSRSTIAEDDGSSLFYYKKEKRERQDKGGQHIVVVLLVVEGTVLTGPVHCFFLLLLFSPERHGAGEQEREREISKKRQFCFCRSSSAALRLHTIKVLFMRKKNRPLLSINV
eukprot:gene11880-8166_t